MPIAPAAKSGEKPATGGKKQVDVFDQYWSVNNPILLHHSGDDVVEYIGGGGESIYHTATIRSNLPLETVGFHQAFGLTIESLGEKGYIALGVCVSSYSTSSLPGWHHGSAGFHADEGLLLDHLEYDGQKIHSVSSLCEVDDVLSCSLHEHPHEEQMVVLIFAKNGSELYRVITELPKDGFFAVAGLMSFGERIRLHADIPKLPKMVREMSVFRSLSSIPADLIRGTSVGARGSFASPLTGTTMPLLSSTITTDPDLQPVLEDQLMSDVVCVHEQMFLGGNFAVQSNVEHVGCSRQGWYSFHYSHKSGSVEHGSLVSCHSLSAKMNYFEVALDEYSKESTVRIGVVDRNYNCDHSPGDVEGSLGYQPNFGLFVNGQLVIKTECSPSTADIIGIEFDRHSLEKPQYHDEDHNTYRPTSNSSVAIYRNNRILCRATFPIPAGGVFPAVGVSGCSAKFTLIYSIGVNRQAYFSRHGVPQGHRNLDLRYAHQQVTWSHVRNATVGESCVVNVVDSSKMAVLSSDRLLTPRSSYFEVRCSDLSSLSLSLLPSVGNEESAFSFFPHMGEFRRGPKIVRVLAVNPVNLEGETFVLVGMGVDFYSADTHKADIFVTFQHVEVGRIQVCHLPDVFPCIRILPASCTMQVVARYPLSWPPRTHHGLGMCRSSKFVRSQIEHIFEYTGSGGQEQMGVVQSAIPLSPSRSYFEVTVVSPGEEGYIGVGLAHMNYPLEWQPGWGPGSIGLHIDDGQLFHGPKVMEHIMPPCPYKSTVIGCGAIFPPGEFPGVVEVYFTVNGKLIARKLSFFPLPGYYPTIGLNSVGSVVEVMQPTMPPHLKLSPFAYCWHCSVSESILTSLYTIPAPTQQALAPSKGVTLKPSSYHMSCFTYSPSEGDYFIVTPDTGKEHLFIAGYILSSTSPVTRMSSDFSFLVDFLKHAVWCDGAETSVEIPFTKQESHAIGIGIRKAKQSSLFFVCVGNQLVYWHPISSDFIRYHRVIQSTSDQEMYAAVDCPSVWPPISPAGQGWGKSKNMICYRGNNLTADEDGEVSKLSYALGAHPLTTEFGDYFEVTVVVARSTMKLDIGMGTHDLSLTNDPTKGQYQLKRSKGAEFISFQSEGRIHGKWHLQDMVDSLPRLALGDTVGCGLTTLSSERVIYFTHNGHIVAHSVLPTQRLLYPLVILQSSVVLQVNLKAVFGWKGLNSTWRLLSGIKPLAVNKFQYSSSVEGLEGILQASTPLSDCRNFVEVEIVTCRQDTAIGVGLCAELTNPVMTLQDSSLSVMYHSKGYVATTGGATAQAEVFGIGDTVGYLVLYASQSPKLSSVDFFKNGQLICHCTTADFSVNDIPVYPTVCLQGRGDIVRIRQVGSKKSPSDVVSTQNDVVNWAKCSKFFYSNHQTVVCLESPDQPCIAQASTSLVPEDHLSSSRDLGKTSYVEVELLSCSEENQITLGVAVEDHQVNASFDSCEMAIGYTCSSGLLTVCTHLRPCEICVFGPSLHRGDIIGVGLRRSPCSASEGCRSVCVYFARNGINIGHTTVMLPSSVALYPTVALGTKGEAVKLYTSSQPTSDVAPFETWQALSRITSSVFCGRLYLQYTDMNRWCGGLAVANVPFSEECSYFEVELMPFGKQSLVAVGLVPAMYRLDKFPGRSKLSFGYQSNGKVFKEHGTGNPVGPCKMFAGDRIGCGLDVHLKKGFCTVYFTYNRAALVQFKMPIFSEEVYPAIGLFYDDKVKVDFYSKSSLPDIQVSPTVSLRKTHHVSYLEQLVRYSGDSAGRRVQNIGVVQFSLPPVEGQFMLNVCLRELTSSDTVLIGFADQDYPNSVFIGELDSSVAYNVNSGSIRCSLESRKQKEHFCSPCTEKDVVGVALVDATPPHIVYALNGQVVCSIPCSAATASSLLPIINVVSQRDTAKLCCYWLPWQCVTVNDLSCE